MSKSFKFKDNMYLDTKGIVHNKAKLNEFLNNLKEGAYRNVKSASSVTHTNYGTATNNDLLPNIAFLSYWNGAYNANGSSNLKYCAGGEIQAKPTFSTNEQVVGKWIDGKTLYTKVLVQTNVTTSTRVYWKTIASGINLDKAWAMGGYAYYATNGYQYPLDGNIGITIQVSASNNHVVIINDNGSGRTFDVYLIIYYTKK